MKIFKSLASGFCRSLKAWKGILVIWFGSLMTVLLVAIPIKSFVKAGFGSSMITERLQNGLDFEVMGDLGDGFKNMIAAFPAGLLLLIIIGVILNAFLAGGIFDNLKGTSPRFSGSGFFRACAKNFWSFLVISLIISAILFVMGLLIITLPFGMVAGSDSGSEAAPYITIAISISVYIMLLMILLLVADYARAWQAANDKQVCFSALGFGFSRTFRTFLSSFPMMFILVAVQAVFSLLVILIIGRWKPISGGGVFLLFLVSQLFFYIKAVLKVWRYGSVTSLMEIKVTENKKTDTIVV